MERPELEQLIKNQLMVARIITASFIMSVAMLIVVLTFLKQPVTAETVSSGQPTFLAQILTIAGFVLLAFSTFLAKLIIPSDDQKLRLLGPGSALGRLFITSIVRLALQEAGAIFGFVGSFLTGDFSYSLALGAGAIVLMGINWPKKEVWSEVIGRAGAVDQL